MPLVHPIIFMRLCVLKIFHWMSRRCPRDVICPLKNTFHRFSVSGQVKVWWFSVSNHHGSKLKMVHLSWDINWVQHIKYLLGIYLCMIRPSYIIHKSSKNIKPYVVNTWTLKTWTSRISNIMSKHESSYFKSAECLSWGTSQSLPLTSHH